MPGGLRWVEDFDTQESGISEVVIPFSDLKPVVRAKPVGLPPVSYTHLTLPTTPYV